jgi:outer membrane protein assembly factor BamB
MPRYCSIKSLNRRSLFLSVLLALIFFSFSVSGRASEIVDSKSASTPDIYANYNLAGLEKPARISWKKRIGEPNRFRGVPQINPSTPVIFGDYLYTGSSSGTLYAFSVDSGAQIWKFESDSSIEASPAVNQDHIAIATLGGKLHLLNRHTGEEVFTYKIVNSINSAPIMDSENIYFITTNNRIHAVDLSDGKKRWTYSQRIKKEVRARFVNSPAQSKDKLFILLSNGVIAALDKKTGKELWRKTLLKGEGPWPVARRTPVYLEGHLYLIDKDGVIVVLDSDSGELRLIFDVGKAVDFLVTQKSVVVATDKEIISINRANGNTDWIESVRKGSIEKIYGAGDHIYIISSKIVEPLWIGYFKKKISYVSTITIDDGTYVWKKKFRSSISANIGAATEQLSILTDKGKLYVFNSRAL